MNNFVGYYLRELKKNNFSCPEIELRALLKFSSKINKDIFLNNISIEEINLNKWNMLAIDALLVLYAINKRKFVLNKKILTIKSKGSNNLGSKYKIMNKNYWERRNQQIIYWEKISKNKVFNLDKLFCKLINFFY